ncbi:hypothetical protein KUTeg_010492 [Tegillarca granosa]|uniref:Uncharacterized protein n=1 Tax=Tegillarca granosa TaxID=220873 RepID=A0ABQ9F6V9_TEGGR|nr:hypothetical protein KUTeg_010492 [Tegillarca granosa]
MQDVFLMIRRKKVTIFTDAKESTTVHEVKRIPLDDNKTLGDYGFTFATARAQAPATVGLAIRQEDGEFEGLEITPLSSPPELPDVMKPQDSTSSHAQEQTAS